MFNNHIHLYIIFNFLITTGLLWIISLLENFYNKNENNFDKGTIYECGFYTINKNIIPIHINTILVLLFVLIYEVEFIVLIPSLLNYWFYTQEFKLTFLVLFFIIAITFYIDIKTETVAWVY